MDFESEDPNGRSTTVFGIFYPSTMYVCRLLNACSLRTLNILVTCRYFVNEQYYTYDSKSLVADFGGYLGLLLGSSLLTFYDLFKSWTSIIVNGIKKKMCQKSGV